MCEHISPNKIPYKVSEHFSVTTYLFVYQGITEAKLEKYEKG